MNSEPLQRRGTTPTLIVGIVLMVIVLIICLLLLRGLRNYYDELESDAPCAAQVYTHNVVVQLSKELKSPTIKCPTKLINLETNEEYEVKQEIAKQMMRCWNTWGQGKKQLFGEQEGLYCHVCSMVQVKGVESIKDFPQFLDTERYKNQGTYSELLQGVKGGEYFKGDQFKPGVTSSFSTTTPTGVIFYYAKGKDWIDTMKNDVVGQPAVGAVGGAAAGGVALYLLVAGGVISSTGVGVPVGAILIAGGAAAGLYTSMAIREDSSHMALVMVRPLTTEQIAGLKCAYDPVSN